MKFLIHSKCGSACGLAYKMKEEGAEVTLYIDEKSGKDMMKGMVDKTLNFTAEVGRLKKDRDVIMFDMVGYGRLADLLKKAGYNVLFGGAFADKLELDRAHGMNVASSAGITVPNYKTFDQLAGAMKYVDGKDARLVLKPEDNAPPSFTAVLDGAGQAKNHLQWLSKSGLYREGKKFILQDFVDGVEVSTEIWFQNGRPLFPANSTIETKKFMAGDIGLSTGCQSSVVWNYSEKEPRIVGQTLKKLFVLCEAVKYTGPLDINCIISYDGQRAHFLEFTSRFGYNAVFAWCRLLDVPIHEFLAEMAFGNLGELPVSTDKFGAALRVSIPPYPPGIEKESDFLEDARLSADKLIEIDDFELIYPSDMKMEGGQTLTAGSDGYVLDIASSGNSIRGVSFDLFSAFNCIKLLDKQARITDGFERACKDYEYMVISKFINKPIREQRSVLTLSKSDQLCTYS